MIRVEIRIDDSIIAEDALKPAMDNSHKIAAARLESWKKHGHEFFNETGTLIINVYGQNWMYGFQDGSAELGNKVVSLLIRENPNNK